MTEESGCQMTELKERGCQMTEESGCHMTELEERGCHMTELEERGCHMTELEERGCHMTELEERGCHMTELEERGCHMTELEESGCQMTELEERGCHMTELEERRCHMTDLEERGCHMTELEERGCHMTELEERGCHMRGKRVEHQQMTDGCRDQFMNLAKMGRKTWRKYFGIRTRTTRCLRNILNIRWPEVVSNEQLWDKTKQTPIETEIRKRKWGWIGHTLRKPASNITRQALDWNPQGKRKVGRPKQTWRRSTNAEIRQPEQHGPS